MFVTKGQQVDRQEDRKTVIGRQTDADRGQTDRQSETQRTTITRLIENEQPTYNRGRRQNVNSRVAGNRTEITQIDKLP